MIKEKEIEALTSWSYDKVDEFDLEMIENALNNNIEEYGYNVAVEYEKISAGSFLSSKEYDCIKLYNPEHPFDYFFYCVTLVRERRCDTVNIFAGGRSNQMKKEDYLKNTKAFDGTISNSLTLGVLKGGSVGVGMAVGGAVGGLAKAGLRGIGKGIAALTRDNEAYEAEQNWYAEAQDLLVCTFSPQD